MKLTRREFIKAGSAASIAAHPFFATFAGLSDAAALAAQAATDYKAIVCVFLTGGNDHANTVVPYDTTAYFNYRKYRGALAYAKDAFRIGIGPEGSPAGTGQDLLDLNGDPYTAPNFKTLTQMQLPIAKDRNQVDRQFALAPPLSPLFPTFFDTDPLKNRLAVLMNVGPLVEPIDNKAEIDSGAVEVPPRLFSHNDQQAYWQSSGVEGASKGWGGVLADDFLDEGEESGFTCVSVSGNALFLTGSKAIQYQVTAEGAVDCPALDGDMFNFPAGSQALRDIVTYLENTHIFANEHAEIVERSIRLSQTLDEVLPQDDTTIFGANVEGNPYRLLRADSVNDLGKQLGMVAKMATKHAELGVKRQVFFVSVGGWDMHSGLLDDHAPKLLRVAYALKAFDDFMKSTPENDKVTLFTASDFGRTLVANGDGSDHGWGGMQFVLGGAVKGGQCYGTPPVIDKGGPDDNGAGRLIPQMAVDQVAGTLALWMGVKPEDLTTVFTSLIPFMAERELPQFMR